MLGRGRALAGLRRLVRARSSGGTGQPWALRSRARIPSTAASTKLATGAGSGRV